MKIQDQFAALRSKGEKGLVLFITAGDPSLDALPDITEALQEAGADILEIGVPFTDPIADGPVIQSSSQRALDRGVTPSQVMDAVGELSLDIPVVLMGYFNPAHRVGLREYARQMAAAGVSGSIMCDLIPEEAGDWIEASTSAGVDTVFLAAPTSTLGRQKVVCEVSTGFVYAVSRTGVTGVGTEVADSTEGLVTSLRGFTDVPICVGFGISQPDHVRSVCEYADGAIIGSWLVDRLARDWEDAFLRSALLGEVKALKDATRG
ncbi:tryptophan synthase subunit alpha [bacterium]|nr:tryptophan synthase subunit alpha [bacterium]